MAFLLCSTTNSWDVQIAVAERFADVAKLPLTNTTRYRAWLETVV